MPTPADRLSREVLVSTQIAAEEMHVPEATVIRWIRQGKRGRRLDGIRQCSQWYTSLEALRRFQGEEAAA